MTDKVRARVIITGRVQGVFFRMETKRAADRIGVCGWVRNRPEGTVEAVFEGTKAKVEDILAWCRDGSPLARVERVDTTWEPFADEFKSFAVTF
jgi:acylphosphatase